MLYIYVDYQNINGKYNDGFVFFFNSDDNMIKKDYDLRAAASQLQHQNEAHHLF